MKAKLWPALAIASLIAAYVIGRLGAGVDASDYLPQALPEAASFELSIDKTPKGSLYVANDEVGNPIGYITLGQGNGYGGPLLVMVSWSLSGTILDIVVPRHIEDLPWFRMLGSEKYFEQYIGRQYTEPLSLDEDIDVVSGATYSSIGVEQGIREGRQLISEHLGDPYPDKGEPIDFGAAELSLLVGLGAVATIRSVPPLRKRNWLRYLALAYGFFVIGVWLTLVLSLTNFTAFVLGYGPHLATNLALYILVFGIVGLALVIGKNYYCYWLCPFAAVQEVVNPSGIQRLPPSRWRRPLRNLRYVIVWFALMAAFLLANPTVTVFEPWNVLFSFRGPAEQWVLVVSVVFVAIAMRNFWCYYICPVGAVMDIVLKVRKGAKSFWRKATGSAKTAA